MKPLEDTDRSPSTAVGQPAANVTFLFTDIEGSTARWERFPDEMAADLARHDACLRHAIDTYRGVVFATGGDGFAAVFDDPNDALSAAIDAQLALADQQWHLGVAIRVRMGIHAGQAEARAGDFFGPSVNRAARIMGAAQGGQIVVSETVARALDRGPDVDLHDLGWHRLKGVPEPVHMYGVSTDGHPWLDRELSTTHAVPGNLPRFGSEFVGREYFVAEHVDDLADHRLVTLAGPGGIGKSRLATELGRLLLDQYSDGVWLVDLAPISDANVVASAVASTLSVSLKPGLSMVDSIVASIADRAELLILDNCEHLIDQVSQLVDAIIQGCPRVCVLTTSREPLGVAGEHVVRVGSLDPADAEALFAARAGAHDDSFSLSADELVTVRQICERLDGIPLAIELAASRLRSLALDELAARLDDRFRVLRGSGRGASERHQTLRATVDWSYQLLSGAEREVFHRLSVFAGTFDIAAAEAVCENPGEDADAAASELDEDVLDVLTSLVDKSIVNIERSDRRVRYRLLETLREFGEECLAEQGGVGEARNRHLRHFLAVAQDARSTEMGPDQLRGDAVFEREWDNIRAAINHARDHDQTSHAEELLWAVFPFAVLRMRYEVADWALGLIAAERPDTPVSGRVIVTAAGFAMFGAEWERSLPMCALTVERATDPESVALAHHSATISLMMLGRVDDALEQRDRAQAAVAETDDPFVRYWVHYSGMMVAVSTDRTELPSWIDRLDEHARSHGAPWMFPALYMAIGNARLSEGDASGALDSFRKMVDVASTARSMLDEGMAASRVITAALALPGAQLNEEVRDMLLRIRDTRSWTVAASACEPIANSFARSGDLETAAIILGGLLADPTSSHRSRLRAETTRLVEEAEGSADLVARGSKMTPSELVDFVVAQLTERAEMSAVGWPSG